MKGTPMTDVTRDEALGLLRYLEEVTDDPAVFRVLLKASGRVQTIEAALALLEDYVANTKPLRYQAAAAGIPLQQVGARVA